MNKKIEIPFYRPDIGAEEINAVIEAVKSGWITTGDVTKEFERKFRDYVGSKYSIAVNSCTAALHLSLIALGVREGEEIIVPSLTFVSTASVVEYLGAIPVVVDVNYNDHLIDCKEIERAITKKTTAIIPVHFAGQPCDMTEIGKIAKQNKLKVIEDAAHAVPSAYKGRMIGSISDASCFSFYATKPITSGEGGMVTVKNKKTAREIEKMSLHGINKDIWRRYSSRSSWKYSIERKGYKYNISDILSALGTAQLEKSDIMYKKRKAIAEIYTSVFKNNDCIEMPIVHNDRKHAWHLFVLKIKRSRMTIGRNQFIEQLKDRGVMSSVHFIPVHMHKYYKDKYGYKNSDFKVSNKIYNETISLPIYSAMTENQIGYVCDMVTEIINVNRR